jgi:ubiquinone/menaquinone biosynthesis C-methylase UbiE
MLLREIRTSWPETKLWGIDLSPEMIEMARSEAAGGIVYAVGDAAALDFFDGMFDVVVSSSSLHHWADPHAVLAEIARVTRSGGRLVITDWSRDVPIFWPLALRLTLFDPTVERIYSRAELEVLVRESGYAIVASCTYRVASFWGIMTVVGRKGG